MELVAIFPTPLVANFPALGGGCIFLQRTAASSDWFDVELRLLWLAESGTKCRYGFTKGMGAFHSTKHSEKFEMVRKIPEKVCRQFGNCWISKMRLTEPKLVGGNSNWTEIPSKKFLNFRYTSQGCALLLKFRLMLFHWHSSEKISEIQIRIVHRTVNSRFVCFFLLVQVTNTNKLQIFTVIGNLTWNFLIYQQRCFIRPEERTSNNNNTQNL